MHLSTVTHPRSRERLSNFLCRLQVILLCGNGKVVRFDSNVKMEMGGEGEEEEMEKARLFLTLDHAGDLLDTPKTIESGNR